MGRLGAGVRKRSDGTLEKRFTLHGKRYSVYGKTSKEIVAKEQEMRKIIAAGIYIDNRKITLDTYFEEWIQGKRITTKSNTLKTYMSYYKNHISPKLGHRKIQKLERREILKLQRDALENLSITSCNALLRIIKIMLNDAVHDGIIVRNPADGIKALKETANKASETYHRALTIEEQKTFMQELSGNYYYEFIALLLCSGMRYGEAAALTWEDIDYKNNVIHVTKTLTYSEDGKLIVGNSAKSETSNRDIPLNETIKGILTKQRNKLESVVPMSKSHVFSAIYGGLVHNNDINRAITSTLKALNKEGIQIEHFTAHALRDTFATRFIEQGGQPQTLKTILGHSSLTMTMDLYAHVLPNTKQQEMDRLYIAL